MTDKDLRRLSRAELLDILYEQRKRYEDSLAENQALRQQLEDRTLRIASAGSIAEAAIQVSGVFEAAQAAADQYLASVKAATAEMVQKTDEAQRQREAIMQDAKQQADKIVQDAQAQADRILAEAGAQVDAPGQNSRKTPTRSSMRTTNCGASSRTAMRTFDFSRFGGRITANDTKRSVFYERMQWQLFQLRRKLL